MNLSVPSVRLRSRRKSWRQLMALGLTLGLLSSAARAQVKASLVAAETSIQPGRAFTVALRLEHQPHWHTYWINAGTGYPTSLTWDLPTGWTASAFQWPVPILIKDAAGKVTGHGYDNTVLLPVTITPPKDATIGQSITLKAKAEWLMCEEMCMPGDATLQLKLPVTAGPPSASASSEAIATALRKLPFDLPTGCTATATRQGNTVTLTVNATGTMSNPHFFSTDGFIAFNEPQIGSGQGTKRLVLMLPVSPDADAKTTSLNGVLAFTEREGAYFGIKINTPFDEAAPSVAPARPPSPPAASASAGLFATLGLAFLGGLILNLMPCVFPVLSIKILGFVQQSGNDSRRVMLHGLAFAAGVFISFWVLAGILAALRAGGGELGWGFQLQSPVFVYLLAVLMLVFALSLSGVFEFGLTATGFGSKLQGRDGLAGSFFTGVLATVVATPCSAPFLAPALGAALTLPPTQAFAVFTAIAAGLSLPYLLLSVFPAAIKILPRPGAWMETFKQLMAFPLYASVGYLLWVLGGQTHESGQLMAFFGLTVVAVAAWFYGRFGLSNSRKSLAAFVVLACGCWIGWPQPAKATDIVWQEWSPEAVAKATNEGRTVYIDFTARWCATCQANKKLVFADEEVRLHFRENNIATLKADWTNRDARITAELAKWNRSAVPFNLIVKPGQPPQPLPELLTPGLVLEALR